MAIWVGLVLGIFVVYAQTVGFDFVNFDDDLYIYGNPLVRAGLAPSSIKGAFTAIVSSNWQPVTLLSHMLDVQLFGLHSGMHHVMNVVYHALSSVLLFLLLRRATGARWSSAFVAGIFALHPLHVESVAWMAERKDVLSTLLFFLALYAYIRYAEKPDLRRYLLVVVLFSLGLMSKPMLVTFPFILLLWDVWPLRRMDLPKIFWEKLPLFALSAVASVIAYRVQLSTGAVAAAIPLDGRIAKAILSYVTYIKQTLAPVGLAVFYPYPHYILASRIAAALLILLGISVLAVRCWRTRPYLAIGWFWYLGTLVPVIGLVKIGDQSHADRYAYIPMVGLALMLAWAGADLARKRPRTAAPVAFAGGAACVLCLVLAWQQVGYWQNSETLYRHAIDVTGDNWLAEANLGEYLMGTPERRAEAMDHLQSALRLKPDNAQAENNLGLCMADAQLCGAAIPHFEAALHSKPELLEAQNNLAMCLAQTGKYEAAIEHLRTVLAVRPNYAEVHLNLGLALAKMGGHDLEAVSHYRAGLRFSPDPSGPGSAQAHRNLGELLARMGRRAEAITELEAAQDIQPDPEISRAIRQLRGAGQ